MSLAGQVLLTLCQSLTIGKGREIPDLTSEETHEFEFREDMKSNHDISLVRSLRRLGFTLVELMVVIVIVAVLGTLSFGVAQRVKTKAALTASLQRARDLGPLLFVYAEENKGRLPVWKDGETYWWEALADPDEYEPERIFRSPGHREFDPDRVEATISYGWNATVMGYGPDAEGGEGTAPKRMVNFRRPGTVLVLTDGAKVDGYGLIEPGGALPDPERYDGKVAGLMLDGSAQVLDAEKDFKADSKWFRETL